MSTAPAHVPSTCTRRVTTAFADSIPTTSICISSTRPIHRADRGHTRRTRRARQSRESPGDRLLELLGRTTSRGRGNERRAHIARFVSVQNHYNMLRRDDERDAIPECERFGIAYLPYFPLESGLLTGKYRLGRTAPEGTRIAEGGWLASKFTEQNLAIIERLIAFAESEGTRCSSSRCRGCCASPRSRR